MAFQPIVAALNGSFPAAKRMAPMSTIGYTSKVRLERRKGPLRIRRAAPRDAREIVDGDLIVESDATGAAA
jgi:hypothetical protein